MPASRPGRCRFQTLWPANPGRQPGPWTALLTHSARHPDSAQRSVVQTAHTSFIRRPCFPLPFQPICTVCTVCPERTLPPRKPRTQATALRPWSPSHHSPQRIKAPLPASRANRAHRPITGILGQSPYARCDARYARCHLQPAPGPARAYPRPPGQGIADASPLSERRAARRSRRQRPWAPARPSAA